MLAGHFNLLMRRSGRQRELERALERWENEGGGLPAKPSPPEARPSPVPVVDLPRYSNDIGAPVIRIGAKEFHCIGAHPPHDHPHIYLNMAGKPDILCPYCSTKFINDPGLRPGDTEPPNCIYHPTTDE